MEKSPNQNKKFSSVKFSRKHDKMSEHSVAYRLRFVETKIKMKWHVMNLFQSISIESIFY